MKKRKLKSLPRRLAPAGERLVKGDSWRAPGRRNSPGDAPSRSPGGNSSARGYGHQWRLARVDYLREHPFCVRCASLGVYAWATVVDHIKPHQGDMKLFWDRANWQGLCATCHSGWKQKLEHADRYHR